MSANIDCLQYAVGLSTTECNCVADTKPSTAGRSDSGLFIGGLPYIDLKYPGNCTDGDIWDILATSRDEAILEFRTALYAEIRKRSRQKRAAFKGLIGNPEKSKTTEYLNLTKPYHGQKWCMAKVTGGQIKIKRIGAWFNQTTSLTLNLYSNYQDAALETIMIDTQANEIKWNDVDITLELKPVYQSYNQFYWLYEPQIGLKPRNTKIDCMCGSSFHPEWNVSSPQFNSPVNKGGFGWADWMLAQGTAGDSLDTLEKFSSVNETQGLIFDVELLCAPGSMICDGEMDYVNNEFALVSAYAIQYLAGYKVIGRILSSQNPSSYSIAATETLQSAMKGFYTELETRIAWLGQEMTKPENINLISDCFQCNDKFGLVKGGIFA